MAFFQNAHRLRLLATAAPLGLMLAATPAMAQDKPATPATPATDAPATDDQATPEIVVTGTLFGTKSLTTTASPVTVLTAENLERAGVTNVSDAIRSISADGAGSIGNGFSSGFSAGGSAVSLRNLGVSSTITLVDGLRSANFPLNDDGHNNYVDLNSIPMANVESIQVLKDGASSLYGADAIGGVVNLITRKTFKGLSATVDGGASEKGEFGKYRGRILVGFGDYSSQGFNIYIGGDYERSAMVSNASLGFPFNTLDLRPIGGTDNNRADDNLTSATPNAVVTRTTQTDLNNPLSGSVSNATSPALFTLLGGAASCPYGTYTENAARVGTGCVHDLQKEYAIFLPFQERYDFVGRASFRLGSNVEGYVAGSYARNRVEISRAPVSIRQTQAFGGSPSTSTINPGIVLPVYICASGVNCATDPNRQLNPNNPYAAAFAANPGAGAARLYYLFGDVKSGSKRINTVYRITGGLKGDIGDRWKWNIDAGYSRDNLDVTVYGNFNLAGLVKAINTGAYNFVNPSLNSEAVRNMVAPPINAKSDSTEFTVDATVRGKLFALPGGDAQLAVGGQFRREELNNRSLNPNLDLPGVSTAQAFGKRSVVAGYFELDLPVLDILDVNLSGRYDHYSTGFGRFSPKATMKLEPVKGFSLRGTYSEGFRAPTFAESDPRSSFSGFVGFDAATAAPAFVAAHPGNAGYTANYSIGRGFVGNPNIQPEISRSFTAGTIIEPTKWLTFTADYFRVRKSNLIVTGPLVTPAIDAYYSVSNQAFASAAAAAAAGCAKVAAIGPGYKCNVVDGADPQNLNALPRLLVLDAPYVNSAFLIVSGLEFSVDARIPISDELKFESRLDVQETLQYDLHPVGGKVQKYAGTVGPEDLSSGGGTPRWRGNWQNTLIFGQFALTATTYYVGKIKAVAADQSPASVTGDISCNNAVYKTNGQPVTKFCYVNSFIYTDLNLAAKVSDQFTFSLTVGNVFGARAPLFANTAYTTQTNYLASWHSAGLIGRTFRAGASFKF